MSRPDYYTESDRQNEWRCARMLKGLGYDVIHLGKFSPADMLISYGTNSYLAEFKHRTHAYGTYPTAIIPADKLERCKSLAKEMGVGFLYISEYTDGYYWAEPERYYVQKGGRVDRNDPKDIYPMAHIPIKDFRRADAAQNNNHIGTNGLQ